MIFKPSYLAGYAEAGLFGTRTVRLFREHVRDDVQFEHWADDWEEEDDAWRWSR